MGLHVIQTAGSGNLVAARDGARSGRTAAMSQRRALAAGRAALTTAPAADGELRPAAPDGVAPARLGRALSMQRRRQLAQGKRGLNGSGDRTAAAAGAGAPTFVVYRGGAG